MQKQVATLSLSKEKTLHIKEIQFDWNENFSIFASQGYLKSKNYEYGWIGGFSENQLKFVLPYLIKKRLFFRYAQFQTDTIYMDESLTIEEEKTFLNQAAAFFRQKNLDFIAQPPTNTVFRTVPDNSEYAEFGSYIIDLTLSEEALWKNLHQKHRNVIRKAMKNDVVIERDKAHAALAYQILDETMKRADKTFILKQEYDRMIEFLGEYIDFFIVYHKNKHQGCAVIPFSQYSAYYLLGGSIERPFTGSLNLLQWEMIKHYKEKGVRCYDFVGARISPPPGSKLEGIQRFKSRFGSTMKTGYLWKFPIHPLRYNLFKHLEIWVNKQGDVIEQEKGRNG